MREFQNSQHPLESENEKGFHTGTKHLILHSLNNGHSREEKKSSLLLREKRKKKRLTVFEPPKQPPPPRLENLTAPVQMGLSGILSLHIHTKKYHKDPSGA